MMIPEIKCWLCGKGHRLIKCYKFLQIILVTLINGEMSIKANAILGARLDFYVHYNQYSKSAVA